MAVQPASSAQADDEAMRTQSQQPPLTSHEQVELLAGLSLAHSIAPQRADGCGAANAGGASASVGWHGQQCRRLDAASKRSCTRRGTTSWKHGSWLMLRRLRLLLLLHRPEHLLWFLLLLLLLRLPPPLLLRRRAIGTQQSARRAPASCSTRLLLRQGRGFAVWQHGLCGLRLSRFALAGCCRLVRSLLLRGALGGAGRAGVCVQLHSAAALRHQALPLLAHAFHNSIQVFLLTAAGCGRTRWPGVRHASRWVAGLQMVQGLCTPGIRS